MEFLSVSIESVSFFVAVRWCINTQHFEFIHKASSESKTKVSTTI